MTHERTTHDDDKDNRRTAAQRKLTSSSPRKALDWDAITPTDRRPHSSREREPRRHTLDHDPRTHAISRPQRLRPLSREGHFWHLEIGRRRLGLGRLRGKFLATGAAAERAEHRRRRVRTARYLHVVLHLEEDVVGVVEEGNAHDKVAVIARACEEGKVKRNHVRIGTGRVDAKLALVDVGRRANALAVHLHGHVQTLELLKHLHSHLVLELRPPRNGHGLDELVLDAHVRRAARRGLKVRRREGEESRIARLQLAGAEGRNTLCGRVRAQELKRRTEADEHALGPLDYVADARVFVNLAECEDSRRRLVLRLAGNATAGVFGDVHALEDALGHTLNARLGNNVVVVRLDVPQNSLGAEAQPANDRAHVRHHRGVVRANDEHRAVVVHGAIVRCGLHVRVERANHLAGAGIRDDARVDGLVVRVAAKVRVVVGAEDLPHNVPEALAESRLGHLLLVILGTHAHLRANERHAFGHVLLDEAHAVVRLLRRSVDEDDQRHRLALLLQQLCHVEGHLAAERPPAQVVRTLRPVLEQLLDVFRGHFLDLVKGVARARVVQRNVLDAVDGLRRAEVLRERKVRENEAARRVHEVERGTRALGVDRHDALHTTRKLRAVVRDDRRAALAGLREHPLDELVEVRNGAALENGRHGDLDVERLQDLVAQAQRKERVAAHCE
eukprot:Opistho-1_new@5055